MTATDTQRAQITCERKQREDMALGDLRRLVDTGDAQAALEGLVFFSAPDRFLYYVETLQHDIKRAFEAAGESRRETHLRFLTELTLALRSFLPRWNLQNVERHGQAVLTADQILAVADELQATVGGLESMAPVAAAGLLDAWRVETTVRFAAEDAARPAAEALTFVGGSIDELITNVSSAIASSHVRRIAEMRAAGQTRTELANDYAAFLPYAMCLGASFVTCNPPLVDMVWGSFPERWDIVADEIITINPHASADELARLFTLEVVYDNMRLLRPIFLLTDGQMGSVCFQVNPHSHGAAGAMISDAVSVYKLLQDRLNGGVPNIVFKLPGTKAGLEACSALTGRGIGVTITVNFGMFQHIPFAKAIQAGQSIYSNLVEMNGRLAFPVRDELLGKLDELAAQGIDEAQARTAAAWSGVAVMKRAHNLLQGKGYDLSQVKTLVASLRIYLEDAYATLPSAFPDMTEIVGTSILSVFPNVRRAFDAQAKIPLEPLRIESPVPEEVLETLTHSEIFKQAYYVSDREWVPDEDERFRPDYELTLEDEAGTASWQPVFDTLKGFSASYDDTVTRLLARKELIQAQELS